MTIDLRKTLADRDKTIARLEEEATIMVGALSDKDETIASLVELVKEWRLLSGHGGGWSGRVSTDILDNIRAIEQRPEVKEVLKDD